MSGPTWHVLRRVLQVCALAGTAAGMGGCPTDFRSCETDRETMANPRIAGGLERPPEPDGGTWDPYDSAGWPSFLLQWDAAGGVVDELPDSYFEHGMVSVVTDPAPDGHSRDRMCGDPLTLPETASTYLGARQLRIRVGGLEDWMQTHDRISLKLFLEDRRAYVNCGHFGPDDGYTVRMDLQVSPALGITGSRFVQRTQSRNGNWEWQEQGAGTSGDCIDL